MRAGHGSCLAIDCRAARWRSAKSKSGDHVLEFSPKNPAPSIVT
jgi:hypothetical protein